MLMSATGEDRIAATMNAAVAIATATMDTRRAREAEAARLARAVEAEREDDIRRAAERAAAELAADRRRHAKPVNQADARLASIADDPGVKAAWGERDLFIARVAAQARAGVPSLEICAFYSGEIQTILAPHILRMGRDDEPLVIAALRKQLAPSYGDCAEAALLMLLKNYRHHDTEALLHAATSTARNHHGN
jgi:hypothetical protein